MHAKSPSEAWIGPIQTVWAPLCKAILHYEHPYPQGGEQSYREDEALANVKMSQQIGQLIQSLLFVLSRYLDNESS